MTKGIPPQRAKPSSKLAYKTIAVAEEDNSRAAQTKTTATTFNVEDTWNHVPPDRSILSPLLPP